MPILLQPQGVIGWSRHLSFATAILFRQGQWVDSGIIKSAIIPFVEVRL